MLLSRRVITLAWLFLLIGPAHPQGQSQGQTSGRTREKLPRVLIIGDSISLGYTEPVRKLLKGQAIVSRPNVNCQHTGFGLANIKQWIGKDHWDVIHFNWGIWDTHMVNDKGDLVRDDAPVPMHIRFTTEHYRKNLTRLVAIMEKTGAKLIWASSTPVMARKGQRFEDIPKLNAVAQEVIRGKGIATNDLYAFVLPRAAELQEFDTVHFHSRGYQELAKPVSESILRALGKAPKTEKPVREAERELADAPVESEAERELAQLRLRQTRSPGFLSEARKFFTSPSGLGCLAVGVVLIILGGKQFSKRRASRDAEGQRSKSSRSHRRSSRHRQ